jgi:hypothetical protein
MTCRRCVCSAGAMYPRDSCDTARRAQLADKDPPFTSRLESTKKPRPCEGSHGGAFVTQSTYLSQAGRHLITILGKSFQYFKSQ